MAARMCGRAGRRAVSAGGAAPCFRRQRLHRRHIGGAAAHGRGIPGFRRLYRGGKRDEAAIEAAVEQVFDLRPASIIEQLGLRRPIYRQLAAYGHMGREELGVAWEQTDKAGALRAAMGL